MDEEKKELYTDENIQGLTRKEYAKFYFFDQTEFHPIYAIIGFTNYHYGPVGNIENNDIIDYYHPEDNAYAEVLIKLCNYYFSKMNMESDVEIVDSKYNLREVKSIKLAALLRQHFTERTSFLNQNYYQLSPQDDLFKTTKQLDSNTRFNYRKHSFLTGVVMRHKLTDKPIIKIANEYKVKLTIQFLENFHGLGDDSFSVEHFFNRYYKSIQFSDNSLIWSIRKACFERIQAIDPDAS